MNTECIITCLAVMVTFSEGLNITATIGQDVTLPCQAMDYIPFKVVEWSRPEKNSEYVLVFDKQNPEPTIPEQSYQGRVELKDMKNGDVSLLLKNVNAEDSGTYECYVQKETNRRKRAIMVLQPVSSIFLHVAPAVPPPPGHEHIGLILGLVVFAVVVIFLVAVVVWKMKKKNASPPPPHDEAVEILQVRL